MIRNVFWNTAVEKQEQPLATSVHKLKIGKVTYTVVSHFNENAKDTAVSKIERLIMRDLKAS